MNELQAEKKAIQTALESIRANDNSLPDASLNHARNHAQNQSHNQALRSNKGQRSIEAPAVPRSRGVDSLQSSPVPNARTAFSNRSPYQSGHRPVPPSAQQSGHRSPQTDEIPTVIQTALQNGFPAQATPLPANAPVNRSPRSPQRNTAVHPRSASRTPLQQLEAQAKQINQLSQTQEVALRRLQTIAAQIDRERREAERVQLANKSTAQANRPGNGSASQRPPVKLSLPLEQSISLPPIESTAELPPTESVTLRLNALGEAHETADEIAQLLRQLRDRHEPTEEDQDEFEEQVISVRKSRRRPPLLRRLQRSLFAGSSRRRTSRHSTRHASRRSSHSLGTAEALSESTPFTLRETLTLLFGAALTRLLLNLLLEAVPLLTIPVMLLLIVPAAIAVYRTTTAPQSGILWGYRLCMILLGLLIGGRL